MEKASLATLPDEVLLDIIESLDTARDIAQFAALSRQCHDFISQSGWRAFVKTRFPSLRIPFNEQTDWNFVANRLTYLDRAWEKRGIEVCPLEEKRSQGRSGRRPYGNQSISYNSVVDAQLTPSLDQELVAMGAGENLLITTISNTKSVPSVWHKLRGEENGHRPGSGDVTAVSVIERNGVSEVVVGRADGDIRVLSSKDDYAQPASKLSHVDDSKLNFVSDPMRQSPGQLAISWTEWQPQEKLLASSRGSLLTLYNLSDGSEGDVSPVAYHDFSAGEGQGNEPSLLRSIKFMGKDTMAFGLGGSREPLRWAKVTPFGLEVFNATGDPSPSHSPTASAEARLESKTTVRAIQPVDGTGSGNLLLSAWDDGTYRYVNPDCDSVT